MVYDIFSRAGIPDGVLNFVAGPGADVGDALINHRKIGGVVFTGSKEVGFGIIRQTGREHPIPVIAEMGGKNPVIVTSKANVDDAAVGVASSAFGYGGQKCSACSRVYVESPVYDEFASKLVKRAKGLKIGDPARRDTNLGPVITDIAVRDFERYADMARTDGRIIAGGMRLTDGELEKGHFVQPTIAADLPPDHFLIKNELFLPFLCLQRVSTIEEALRRANDVEYGLTAGIYSQDESELKRFFDNIEAGVVYSNRRRGGSTGAMVGGQAFGGWKASGSTGKGAGGEYYLLQFMREQSRTSYRLS
jgi:1-pyrroline-5-carboxylate dehydrogenase